MSTQNIVLGIVVVIILYVLYLYYFGDATKKSLVGMHDATVPTLVSSGSLPPGASSNFTFSIWVYVSDWNYGIGKFKPIFVRAKPSGDPKVKQYCPMVKFDKNLNNVIIEQMVYEKGKSTPSIESATLDNLPLQKWCNIILSVNNRALDIYLDGKLVKTKYFGGVPKVDADADLVLTPNSNGNAQFADGFKGYTAKFMYYARAVNPREAYSIYKEGYGSNWLSDLFNKYKIKIAFMKDQEELNSFMI
jgi:hypothetical protein